jgi:glycosyltransferase involved in cell wall biosynthesis
VANYEPLKDQPFALEAYLESNPGEAVLVFIGGELNDYARHLQRQYLFRSRSERWDRVMFLENLGPGMLAAAYRAADIFLCSSRTETQPLVLLDAMAAGVPFISTDVGCVAQLPGGVVVRSQREMADRIIELRSDKLRRQELGNAGRAAVDRYYNWKHVVTCYDNLLRTL